MRIKIKYLIICCCVCVGYVVNAQEPEHREAKVQSPELIARNKTNYISSELHLTDKQYNKIYKLFLKEEKTREKELENSFMSTMNSKNQMSEGAGNSGRTPMGGGPSGGMGGPGGGAGGPGGGMGGPGGGMSGGTPPSSSKKMSAEDIEKKMLKAEAKREKKIKKILTSEQYTQWISMKEKKVDVI